uniref:AlNc14C352G10921 protein n=1 Tax=Albugo laibachii Nc14 TaxID=890382 RepID=F0WXH0_9STRA|nr:AlNc14C352G10921 [Albugo laibachii Nc14]|eukprot:CCA26163.1 AlNc14C352G10921 [Albugo laibachii Nc14]
MQDNTARERDREERDAFAQRLQQHGYEKSMKKKAKQNDTEDDDQGFSKEAIEQLSKRGETASQIEHVIENDRELHEKLERMRELSRQEYLKNVKKRKSSCWSFN